jgi:hypothetical protein
MPLFCAGRADYPWFMLLFLSVGSTEGATRRALGGPGNAGASAVWGGSILWGIQAQHVVQRADSGGGGTLTVAARKPRCHILRLEGEGCHRSRSSHWRDRRRRRSGESLIGGGSWLAQA